MEERLSLSPSTTSSLDHPKNCMALSPQLLLFCVYSSISTGDGLKQDLTNGCQLLEMVNLLKLELDSKHGEDLLTLLLHSLVKSKECTFRQIMSQLKCKELLFKGLLFGLYSEMTMDHSDVINIFKVAMLMIV